MFSLSKKLWTFALFFVATTSAKLTLVSLDDYDYEKEDVSPPIVYLEDGGGVIGTWKPSRNETDFSAFMGIPFAKPPIGDLRFKRPVPNEPWEGYFGKFVIKVVVQYLSGQDQVVR